MKQSISQRLKEFRKEKKISQSELAKQLGVSQSYLAGVERETNEVNSKLLNSLKEKYNISADWLLFGKEANGGLSSEVFNTIRQLEDLLEKYTTVFYDEFDKSKFEKNQVGKYYFTEAKTKHIYKEINEIDQKISSNRNEIITILETKTDPKNNFSSLYGDSIKLNINKAEILYKLVESEFKKHSKTIITNSLDNLY
jgi:transcriptional regulator with XRE-family HTH domain